MSERKFGRCSACFEITAVDDPCCPMAGVIVDGSFVRAGDEDKECAHCNKKIDASEEHEVGAYGDTYHSICYRLITSKEFHGVLT